MSQTLVVALDSSDLSARALPFARMVAHLWRGRVLLVHATIHPGDPRARRIEGQLMDLVSTLRTEGIDAEIVLRAMPPARAIVDVARAQQAELIVMASHQRHGFDRWLHGSVTEEVLQHSMTPLLVVPARAEVAKRQTTRLLVPLDGSPVGDVAVDVLQSWAARRPIEARLLRVVATPGPVVGWNLALVVPPMSADEIEAEVRHAQAYLAERAEALQAQGVPVRRQVIESPEPVARVILDTAQREQVDGIVLGTHGKGNVARLVLGSVSEDVLEHALVPVLLVRPKALSSNSPFDGGMSSASMARLK
jgi:nucleotide-binding universal stress UspA family protein